MPNRRKWNWNTSKTVGKKKKNDGKLPWNNLMYKRNYNQRLLEYKARTGRLRGKMLDSGYYSDQVWGGLIKAWLAYTISFKHDDWEKRKYYAAVIQKLQKDLRLKQYEFEEMQELAAEYLENHEVDPELNKMSVEEIEELMKQSSDDFWREVNR